MDKYLSQKEARSNIGFIGGWQDQQKKAAKRMEMELGPTAVRRWVDQYKAEQGGALMGTLPFMWFMTVKKLAFASLD